MAHHRASHGTTDGTTIPLLRYSGVAFAFYLALYFLGSDGYWRLLLYAFPAIFLLEATITSASVRVNAYIFAMSCAFTLTYLPGASAEMTAFKEFSFVLLSVLLASLVFSSDDRFRDSLLLAGALNVLAVLLLSESPSIGSFIVSSRGAAESSFGLVLPLAAILYFMQRHWIRFLLAVLLSFLMYKRLALVAMFVAIAIDYIWHHGHRSSQIAKWITCVSILVATLLFAFNSQFVFSSLSDWLLQNFDVRASPNEISSGRHYVTGLFAEHMRQQANFIGTWFGHGPGFSSSFLGDNSLLYGRNFLLLHNDYLRIFSDFGAVGTSVAVTGFVWGFSRNRIACAFAVYTAIVFATDNVATYLAYWISFILLLRTTGARVLALRDRLPESGSEGERVEVPHSA